MGKDEERPLDKPSVAGRIQQVGGARQSKYVNSAAGGSFSEAIV